MNRKDINNYRIKETLKMVNEIVDKYKDKGNFHIAYCWEKKFGDLVYFRKYIKDNKNNIAYPEFKKPDNISVWFYVCVNNPSLNLWIGEELIFEKTIKDIKLNLLDNALMVQFIYDIIFNKTDDYKISEVFD